MARIETELVIDAGRAIVSLGGALDVSNAHRLGAMLRRLLQEGWRDIVLDLAAVETVDAAGVGILKGAARAVAAHDDGSFCFQRAPGDLAAFLSARGLRDVEGQAPREATRSRDPAAAAQQPAPSVKVPRPPAHQQLRARPAHGRRRPSDASP